jgi:hypothetical protein
LRLDEAMEAGIRAVEAEMRVVEAKHGRGGWDETVEVKQGR